MSYRLRLIFCGCIFFASVTARTTAASDEWQPINPDELKMTSVPEAPGAPAVYLYRQVDRDDTARHEYNYVRIKVLTEEGRKYATLELPFFKGYADIVNWKARTIRRDGTVVNFEGKPNEKTIVKAKGLKYLALVLVLPDVEVGSIIEYHYTYQYKWLLDSQWILSEELFTKKAKFSLKPSHYLPVRYTWRQLPPGTPPPTKTQELVTLETTNIPAFQTEDYMPPLNELKSRVDFVYADSLETQPEKFWKNEGKKQNELVESFIGKRKAMEQAVTQMVSQTDTPEVKLQKIYARVQQVRNTGYEAEVTEQEKKRGKEKEIKNVEDILKSGHGSGHEINWLFLALVRAAGIEASPVLVSWRSEYFFYPAIMDPSRLSGTVVMVKLNGKESNYDPGTMFAPFGMLPWPETSVVGLKLDKEGGAWVMTSIPDAEVSNIQRKAELKLTDQGNLEGKLKVTFGGLEALALRLQERLEDAATRKTYLEDAVREYIPVNIEVELTNSPDWSSSAPTLVGEFDLKVQGWASGAGRRALIPVGLFGAPEKHVFERESRVHPIYFDFPTARMDDVTIELPLDWKVDSLPPAHVDNGRVCTYSTTAENKQGTLHLTRKLTIVTMGLQTKYYPALRGFFQTVRAGDEQQIVVLPGAAAAAN